MTAMPCAPVAPMTRMSFLLLEEAIFAMLRTESVDFRWGRPSGLYSARRLSASSAALRDKRFSFVPLGHTWYP